MSTLSDSKKGSSLDEKIEQTKVKNEIEALEQSRVRLERLVQIAKPVSSGSACGKPNATTTTKGGCK